MEIQHDYYEDLIFDYDKFSESSFLKLKPHICVSTFFLLFSTHPNTDKPAELAQVDAFWMLHFFRWGSIDVQSAERLVSAGILKNYGRETGGTLILSPTGAGWGVIHASLFDRRVSEKVFPFIEDAVLLPKKSCFEYRFHMSAERYHRSSMDPSRPGAYLGIKRVRYG